MPSLAITGTIGSGKSTLLHGLGSRLGNQLGAPPYSADLQNRRLLDLDPEVKALICSEFGASFYQEDGTANRKLLFDLISRDSSARATLESILHPRLRAVWKTLAERFRESREYYFLAEIPLLFEKDLEVFFDKTIVVGCSDGIRRERLQRLRSLTTAEASAWLTMQVPQETKIARADHLLWNDGSEYQLHHQIDLLASFLLQS